MTEANGFNDGAVYVGDYLNGSGESGYLGIQTTARYDSEVLVTAEQSGGQTRVSFAALEGIPMNPRSTALAPPRPPSDSMSVGPLGQHRRRRY